MKVSDMTVQQDLIELKVRASDSLFTVELKSNQHLKYREIPHEEKLYQVSGQADCGQKAVELIEDGDTVFLGQGLLWRCWLRKSAISICAWLVSACFHDLLKKVGYSKVFLLGGECGAWLNTLLARWPMLSRIRCTLLSVFSGNGIQKRADYDFFWRSLYSVGFGRSAETYTILILLRLERKISPLSVLWLLQLLSQTGCLKMLRKNGSLYQDYF